MYVFELPPKLSCRIRVSLESRYGTNLGLPLVAGSVKAEMTFPKHSRPMFILIPYRIVDPVAPVFFNLSEPAILQSRNPPRSQSAMFCTDLQ
jgi:hypothetical protein